MTKSAEQPRMPAKASAYNVQGPRCKRAFLVPAVLRMSVKRQSHKFIQGIMYCKNFTSSLDWGEGVAFSKN